MKLGYDEIESYYDKGLLDSIRLSLGLPWEGILELVFNQVRVLQEGIDDLEVAQDIEMDYADQVYQLSSELAEVKDELCQYKEGTS